ncbi:MAG: DUF445 family protein [Tissierellia bacterium]|nr:DUF445 family protein [Tissierellia bacterium]
MKFIIPIVVGAVIGYITNWFAIKMLFRPHYEQRIFGIRVPFTPGLIPKEKGRIAKSVGETVSAYLLSPEIIIDSISNDENNDKVKSWVEDNINKLKESNKSIRDLAENIVGEKYDYLSTTIEESITDFICSEIEKQAVRQRLMELSDKEAYCMVNEIEQDEKTLKEIIPADVVLKAKEYIEEHDEYITNGLRNIFEMPSIQIKVKESISEVVSQNVNRLITKLVSVELITDKIFAAIENYIYSPRINKDIVLIATTSIDKLLENKISTESLYRNISLIVHKNMDKFMNIPISHIIKDIDEATVSRIADFSKTIFETFTKNRLPYFVELLDISRVIEDEINKFDVAFAEEIIIEIANKELKAITWLGALLGGIMGILMPFLTMLSAS